MSADRFPTGKPADRLVDNGLKNGGGKILFGSALVDQGLNIGLGKYAASCRNCIEGFIVFGIFVQPGSIGLDQRCHLVDKRACAAGTDTVHTLLNITAFKINDLCILSAQLDSNIGLGSQLL